MQEHCIQVQHRLFKSTISDDKQKKLICSNTSNNAMLWVKCSIFCAINLSWYQTTILTLMMTWTIWPLPSDSKLVSAYAQEALETIFLFTIRIKDSFCEPLAPTVGKQPAVNRAISILTECKCSWLKKSTIFNPSVKKRNTKKWFITAQKSTSDQPVSSASFNNDGYFIIWIFGSTTCSVYANRLLMPCTASKAMPPLPDAI